MKSKNDDNTKILTISSYTRFGKEVNIASMNCPDLFEDTKFAKTHKVLYGKDLFTVTEIDELKDPNVYYTDDNTAYTLIKSLKGTYEAIKINDITKEN